MHYCTTIAQSFDLLRSSWVSSHLYSDPNDTPQIDDNPDVHKTHLSTKLGSPPARQKSVSSKDVLLTSYNFLNDRQITHLICVRLRHLLYDLFWGVFWAFYIMKQQEGGPKTPPQTRHIANVLGGHRLDESSGGRLLSTRN